MDSDRWGPHAWYFIEVCALHLDPSDTQSKQKFVEFLETLPFILPCDTCKKEVSMYINKNPIPNDNIVDWVIGLHNHVRKRYNKSQLSKSDVINYYQRSHLILPILFLIFLVFLVS